MFRKDLTDYYQKKTDKNILSCLSKKYTSKTIREVLEKVDGIAFSNGKVDGIGWGDYRLSDAERDLYFVIKKGIQIALRKYDKILVEIVTMCIMHELFKDAIKRKK
jgi:hypothetical protein